MTLRRFHHHDLSADRVTLPDDEAKHARKVLRLEAGESVELFDGAGTIADAVVESVAAGVTIRIERRRAAEPVRPAIDLAVPMPKGDRAAVLVEKASELGVDRLIPLITQRSVVDPGRGKLSRFDRIALESAKQCGRPWVMRIDPPTRLDRVLRDSAAAVRLIADPQGVQELPASAVDPRDAARVLVLIGPEGGWTLNERAEAEKAGFSPWRFGPYVLRVETAALAAVAILRRHS